jgi:hypothetical protein
VAASERLKAMDQLEARALGRPKETVEQVTAQLPDDIAAIRAMSLEERLALLATLGPLELASK